MDGQKKSPAMVKHPQKRVKYIWGDSFALNMEESNHLLIKTAEKPETVERPPLDNLKERVAQYRRAFQTKHRMQ